MKSTGRITGIITATAVAGMLIAASASADERHRDGTWRGDNDSRFERHDDGGWRHETRNNNHIDGRGRIRNFTRERDGYRVWLDRDERPYWIPSYRLGRHRLNVGLDVRLGGVFNGGYVDVDTLGWPGDPYYNDGYYGGGYGGGYYNRYDGVLSGIVERVDFRDGTILLRDNRSGRVVNVDMRGTDRGNRRLDFDDLRRGDRITLSGSWDDGWFHAYRIDGVRQY